ncbi:hypothetical protein RND81_01G066500 [Saponaria officinalis]|uniref:Ankyrin repeat protein n=1 Tax=Saponaria officinalis TaxID=3572 RepID=A0AAW1ND57_SAPOF
MNHIIFSIIHNTIKHTLLLNTSLIKNILLSIDRLNILIIKLIYATVEGDMVALGELLRKDKFLLDRHIIEKSPYFASTLHVAADIGHLEFTLDIVGQKPKLAEEVD